MIDLPRARAELASKTKQQIEASTAETWAARAVAAYARFIDHILGAGAPVIPDAASYQLYAEAADYEHEALEHAAPGGIATFIGAQKKRLGIP